MGLRIAAPNLLLPWHRGDDDEDRRFRRILGWCLLSFLLLALVIPLIETPEPEREELETLPPQLARVVLEKKALPEPPPPPEPEPEPEPQAEPEPELKPEPQPELEKPAEVVREAREKARRSGVLQFADDLADMRDSIDVNEVSSANITRGGSEAAEVDRALLARRSDTTSGGVDTSNLSRNTGGTALSGRETTQVDSKLAREPASTDTRAGTTGERSSRNNESIRKVMDQNKSAIFAIYNRVLRKDPTLEGRVVVKMVIEPGGAVSAVEVVSSDLNHNDLESKILARIRMINFGAENVGRATLNYTFDFLPS